MTCKSRPVVLCVTSHHQGSPAMTEVTTSTQITTAIWPAFCWMDQRRDSSKLHTTHTTLPPTHTSQTWTDMICKLCVAEKLSSNNSFLLQTYILHEHQQEQCTMLLIKYLNTCELWQCSHFQMKEMSWTWDSHSSDYKQCFHMLWHCGIWYKPNDTSEKQTASFIKVKG